jgi:two-component system cell cycle sensor histidine kinase PleC
MTTECIEKDVFEHSPYAHLVLRVTQENGLRNNPGDNLTLEICNSAAGTLYGLNPHHVVGRQLHHVLVKPMADFLEENGLRCIEQQKMLITEPSQLHPITDAQQSFTFNPLRNKAGHITHLSIVALPYAADTLELQKERDHALMLMSSAFDASSLGIFVTDHQRRILRVNEAFLREFGFRRRDVIGKDFSQIYIAGDRKAVQKTYKNFLRGQSESRHEWCIHNAHEKDIDVLVTTAPLHLQADRALVVHTLVDISEHKHVEESLRWAKEQADSANRAKSAFLAGMSHELRTPLNAILGFSELMQTETFGPLGHEKYAEYMHDIHFAASHLLEIINDVLDMSKIEAGKFELLEQSIDLPNLFQSVMRVMAERAEMAGVIVDTMIEDGLVTLYADKRILRQMLFNLVSNAIKFSAFGGEVHIGAVIDAATKNIKLYVSDQGPGISEKDITRMMEPFNQGQVGISDGTGTGLGLPLTRAMAELHGGSLKLDSASGKGTTATIILPKERNISQTTKSKAFV